jgi:dGTPase
MQERQLRRAIVHEVIDWQVCDAIEHAASVLGERCTGSIADVRKSPVMIMPSASVQEKKRLLERFLFDNVYRHPRVIAQRMPAQQALREMFAALMNAPGKLPLKFRRLAEQEGVPRATGDYLAGMTDRFAFEEHRRLIAS